MLDGAFDIGRIEDVFKKLIKRHDSLRTSFIIINDEPVQRIQQEFSFAINCFKFKEEDIEKIKDLTLPFDLSKAPLFRVSLININSKIQYCFLIFTI